MPAIPWSGGRQGGPGGPSRSDGKMFGSVEAPRAKGQGSPVGSARVEGRGQKIFPRLTPDVEMRDWLAAGTGGCPAPRRVGPLGPQPVAFRTLIPHVSPAAVPELVRDSIRHGEAHGRWTPTR